MDIGDSFFRGRAVILITCFSNDLDTILSQFHPPPVLTAHFPKIHPIKEFYNGYRGPYSLHFE
jgi:hypothetical protein